MTRVRNVFVSIPLIANLRAVALCGTLQLARVWCVLLEIASTVMDVDFAIPLEKVVFAMTQITTGRGSAAQQSIWGRNFRQVSVAPQVLLTTIATGKAVVMQMALGVFALTSIVIHPSGVSIGMNSSILIK